MTDMFWEIVAAQTVALRSAATAAAVLDVVARHTNPYDDAGITTAPGFYAGSGDEFYEALRDAGWEPVWFHAPYHFALRAANGDVITYVEGDVFADNRKPIR